MVMKKKEKNISPKDMHKIVIKTVEEVKIKGKRFLARIDTGATKSSICESIAENLKLGPPIRDVKIRNVHGISNRKIIKIKVSIAGRQMNSLFNVTKRQQMKYPILIGRNILKRGFLIEC
jgi:hypothetical protein